MKSSDLVFYLLLIASLGLAVWDYFFAEQLTSDQLALFLPIRALVSLLFVGMLAVRVFLKRKK